MFIYNDKDISGEQTLMFIYMIKTFQVNRP